MRYNLYVVKDKLAEEAGPPFQAVNDKVAIRHFNAMNIPEALKDEYELLCVGSYDSKEIFIVPEICYSVVNQEENNG